MNIVSKVVEVLIETGVRFIKILRFGESDVVKTKMLSSFGDDFNVPKDYKALYIRTSNSNEPICIGFVNSVILDDLNSGEKQMFSTNDVGDTISSYIKFLNDGTMHINGDADNVVGFAKNKEGFDTAITDLNGTIGELNKIITALNSWIPVPQDGGLALKTLILGNLPINLIDSTASIDDSKKDNILIE